MKKLINNFMSNHKMKYMLMTVASVLTIGAISFLVFGGIKKNKNTNNSLGKNQIRNKLFHENPSQGTINSIFVNTTPNNVSTIYVGGKDLKASDTSTKLGALITSSDNGKTWKLDQYFANPDNAGATSTPIIHKVMTDFYNDKDGTSDMIVVAGEYLKSIPTPGDGKGNGNGNSVTAGQIAYKDVYHSIFGSKINIIIKHKWADVAGKDYDSDYNYNDGLGYGNKLVTASTVISSMHGSNSSMPYIRDHIYIITRNRYIDVNDFSDIPSPDQQWGKTDKFSIYDFANTSSDVKKAPVYVRMTTLSKYLNPLSIYGTHIPNTGFGITKTTFNPGATSFVFMSGMNKPYSEGANHLCFIAENQHYDAQKPGEKTDPNNKSAFDKSIIIQYDTTGSIGTATGATYVGVNSQLDDSPIMDNFLIKSISVNPESITYDGKYGTNSLILAGEKDNKSYMINPTLVLSNLKQLDVRQPVMPTNSSFATNKDVSYINKVIPINTYNLSNPDETKKVTIEPLILFGKNMNTPNTNIVFPDKTYIKSTTKDQHIEGQGIMLANIKFTTTLIGGIATYTSSVHYSLPDSSWLSSPSMVKYVDNSENYNSTELQSFRSDYTFMSFIYKVSNFFKNTDFSNYKIIKSKDGDYSIFSNA